MNHESYIEKSVSSAVAQTYPNVEIIYLDNFSTDASFEKADAIFKKSGLPYKGFKREQVFGISANANFLISQASGKYLSLLSADDWWDASNIEEKIAFYEKSQDYGLLHGAGYICYYDTGEIVKEDVLNGNSGWMLKEMLRRNFVNTNGVILRRDVLDDVGLFDEKSNLEDWDMWIRIAEKYPILFFPKPLVYYGKQHANISDNKAYMKEGYAYIFEKYFHYKEIAAAKDYYKMVDVYEAATLRPNLHSLGQLIKHFRFSALHLKQIAKLFLGIAGVPVAKKRSTTKK
jgi:glycosyltransferase involved in cell wall biosynthesis